MPWSIDPEPRGAALISILVPSRVTYREACWQTWWRRIGFAANLRARGMCLGLEMSHPCSLVSQLVATVCEWVALLIAETSFADWLAR